MNQVSHRSWVKEVRHEPTPDLRCRGNLCNGQRSGLDFTVGGKHACADLPGWFKKTVIVGPEETGFLTSNGTVIRDLSAVPHKVGFSFLGWGSSNRATVKLHNRPFRLRLHFSNLLSKGYESLDAIIHLTALLSAPSLFYSTILRGKDGLNSSQLASTIAAGIDDLIQVKVTETDGQALRRDRGTQDNLMREL